MLRPDKQVEFPPFKEGEIPLFHFWRKEEVSQRPMYIWSYIGAVHTPVYIGAQTSVIVYIAYMICRPRALMELKHLHPSHRNGYYSHAKGDTQGTCLCIENPNTHYCSRCKLQCTGGCGRVHRGLDFFQVSDMLFQQFTSYICESWSNHALPDFCFPHLISVFPLSAHIVNILVSKGELHKYLVDMHTEELWLIMIPLLFMGIKYCIYRGMRYLTIKL